MQDAFFALFPAGTFHVPDLAKKEAVTTLESAAFAVVRGHTGAKIELAGQANLRLVLEGFRQLAMAPVADIKKFLKASMKPSTPGGPPPALRAADCATWLGAATPEDSSLGG